MSDFKSPFQNPNGDMPKPIPGKSLGPELASYQPRTDVPVGEKLMGGPTPGAINSPFDNPTSIKNVNGPKNP